MNPSLSAVRKFTISASSWLLSPRLPMPPNAPVGFTRVAGEGLSGDGNCGLPRSLA